MIVIGLTGSIGMGKSTVASMFKDLGAAAWCADDAVHRLYTRGGAAVAPVGDIFEDVIVDGAVDRARLAKRVLNNPEALRSLEAIVHPLVAADRLAFLKEAEASGAQAAVLDIPLLFETGSQDAFDVVVVVSAPEKTQRDRVLARPGMTPEKFAAILSQQMPDAEKRARADYVISTGQSLEATRAEVDKAFAEITARPQE